MVLLYQAFDKATTVCILQGITDHKNGRRDKREMYQNVILDYGPQEGEETRKISKYYASSAAKLHNKQRKKGRPGSSEVPRNPLTRWGVSSIPANEIFLTKKLKNK